jgi:2-keto-3-deoxy-L-rhamnonate aldolase RhmA
MTIARRAMPDLINSAKQRLAADQAAIGFGIRQSRTVDVAQIARTCGFDWLFIDMEHGALDLETAAQISLAALAVGIAPIVRVPGIEHHHATRALDAGALGIVVPHVDTAEQARRVADQCRFPPTGHRSIPGGLPQLGFAAMPVADAMAKVDAATLLVVMLETEEAIANADAIAAVDGIDVLLIGSNDLTADMGIPGQFGDAKLDRAYDVVIAAARRHGKHAGLGGIYEEKLMDHFIRKGARFVLGGADLAFMMAGARNRAAFLRAVPL